MKSHLVRFTQQTNLSHGALLVMKKAKLLVVCNSTLVVSNGIVVVGQDSNIIGKGIGPCHNLLGYNWNKIFRSW